jgi:hypothetical protein
LALHRQVFFQFHPPGGVAEHLAALPLAGLFRHHRQPRRTIGAVQQRLAQVLQHRWFDGAISA